VRRGDMLRYLEERFADGGGGVALGRGAAGPLPITPMGSSDYLLKMRGLPFTIRCAAAVGGEVERGLAPASCRGAPPLNIRCAVAAVVARGPDGDVDVEERESERARAYASKRRLSVLVLSALGAGRTGARGTHVPCCAACDSARVTRSRRL
jgi:hypothetical protein